MASVQVWRVGSAMRRVVLRRVAVLVARMAALPLLVGTAALPAWAGTDPAVAAFAPHRAVYDLSLGDTSDDGSVNDVSGRMVFEFTGSACDGFTVNFRMVTRVEDDDGTTRTTDLRTSSFEGGEANEYQFLTQNFVDQQKSDETKGVAKREHGEVLVDLVQPAKKREELAKGVVFPTQHLARLIEAAEKGETVVQADLYDGSDDGEQVYATTAFIGKEVTGPDPEDGDDPKAVANLKGIRHWPIRLSYFDPIEGHAGEQTPSYQMSFLLYANGVTRRLKLDYGDFVVDSKLTQLDLLPTASDCKK